jgi:hypothetical protein
MVPAHVGWVFVVLFDYFGETPGSRSVEFIIWYTCRLPLTSSPGLPAVLSFEL